MKNTLIFLLAFCFTLTTYATGSNVGTIVVHLKNTTIEEQQLVLNQLNKYDYVHLEYRCISSGVYVFKLRETNFTNKGDVEAFFFNKMKSVISNDQFEMLHVEILLNEDSDDC